MNQHLRSSRKIMQHLGQHGGPLLIVIAGSHGNEQAGIRALQLLDKMLDVEPITNPNFKFKGKIVGLVGNLEAVNQSVRFIDKDLNRLWEDENIAKIKGRLNDFKDHEEKEILGLLSFIEKECEDYNPSSLYILDLHTTSSDGGIFAIPNYDKESLRVAQNLHAPVILGLLKGISGTTLHYFKNDRFPGLPCTCVTFEAGQHDDPISINRCIAAIVNCLRSIACVQQEDVESIHDNILISYSSQLPKVTRLLYKHAVLPDDEFEMIPGFRNFDHVQQGDLLAKSKHGPVISKIDGLILMPLYQKQGAEGFYIVEEIDELEGPF